MFYIKVSFKLKKWSIIWPVIKSSYKIINREINNSHTSRILKNRFKKIKNSSKMLLKIYLLFEIPLPKNTIEKINEINSTNMELPETFLLRIS